MATAIRPVGHEDRLSIVEHLDELRTRILIALAVFVAAFAFCAWQNHAVLHIVNRPLEKATAHQKSNQPLEQSAKQQSLQADADAKAARAFGLMASENGLSAATRQAFREAQAASAAAAKLKPSAAASSRRPVTLGVGEPFVTTITVAAWAALLLSLPLILYQLYAFILPAFTAQERRVALPLMSAIPALFIVGVVFGYFVVLPPAVRFLQNFNNDSFDILVQARDYYRFSIMTLVGMGLLFQIPVGILALTRLGVVSVAQLRGGRRYAIVACAVIAMLLPGTDPVTMLLSMLPLVVLYEVSILIAALMDRRQAAAEAASDPDGPDLHHDEDL
jgi:sec-independent protein translocase protein TatC